MRTRGTRHHRWPRPLPRGLEAIRRGRARPASPDDPRRKADADHSRLQASDDGRPRLAPSPLRTLPPLPLLELSRHLAPLALPRIQTAADRRSRHGKRLLLRHHPRARAQEAHRGEVGRLDPPLRDRSERASRKPPRQRAHLPHAALELQADRRARRLRLDQRHARRRRDRAPTPRPRHGQVEDPPHAKRHRSLRDREQGTGVESTR